MTSISFCFIRKPQYLWAIVYMHTILCASWTLQWNLNWGLLREGWGIVAGWKRLLRLWREVLKVLLLPPFFQQSQSRNVWSIQRKIQRMLSRDCYQLNTRIAPCTLPSAKSNLQIFWALSQRCKTLQGLDSMTPWGCLWGGLLTHKELGLRNRRTVQLEETPMQEGSSQGFMVLWILTL